MNTMNNNAVSQENQIDRLYQLFAICGQLFTIATGMCRWSRGDLVVWDLLLPTRQQRSSGIVVDPVHRVSERPLGESRPIVFLFGPLGPMIYAPAFDSSMCEGDSDYIWYNQVDRIITPIWARESLKLLGLNLDADEAANRRAGEFVTTFPAINEIDTAKRCFGLAQKDFSAIHALAQTFEAKLPLIEDPQMVSSVEQLLGHLDTLQSVMKTMLGHVVSDGGLAIAEGGSWHVAEAFTDFDLALRSRDVLHMDAFETAPVLPERLTHAQKREITRLFKEEQAARNYVPVEERIAGRVIGDLERKTRQGSVSAAPAFDKALEAKAAETPAPAPEVPAESEAPVAEVTEEAPKPKRTKKTKKAEVEATALQEVEA